MTIQRLDHVSIVVDDLPAAMAFFVELGLKDMGETTVEGEWVNRCVPYTPRSCPHFGRMGVPGSRKSKRENALCRAFLKAL